MEMSHVYALLGSLLFAGASPFYARLSKEISITFMNLAKAIVAFVGFLIWCWWAGHFSTFEFSQSTVYLILSGVLGLALGDLLLFKGFVLLGSSRTLMIFSFAPALVGVGSYFLFGHALRWSQFWALLFLMACTFTIGLEKFRSTRKWEVAALLFAIGGVICDSMGVLCSRLGFEADPGVSSAMANLLRFVGGIAVLSVLTYTFGVSVRGKLRELPPMKLFWIVVLCFVGTFLGLTFTLKAIQTGHLPTISALVGVNPVFSVCFESIYERKWPTRSFWTSFAFFVVGFLILTLG